MKFFQLVVLGLCSVSLLAETNYQELLTKLGTETKFSADISYTSLGRNINASEDIVSTKVNDILQATITAVLFPKEYDLKLSYTHSMTENVDGGVYNPQGHDKRTSSYAISVIPYYDKTYGGVGLFYTNAELNSQYTNNSAVAMMLTQYQYNPQTGPGLQAIASAVQSKQTFQSKEEMSYLGIKYMLPEHEYLPKGSNIYYSIMDRTTVYYGNLNNTNHLIYMSGKGNLYGFGLQKELHELPNKELSLDLLQFSKGGFSDFPDLSLLESSVGATYKYDSFYVKGFALVYIAEEYNGNMGAMKLNIPQVTDILFNLRVGMSF